MKTKFGRLSLFAILPFIILVSGCASTPGQMGNSIDDREKKTVAAEINDQVNKICAIPGAPTDTGYWQLRYIRAQLILSAITRYGAARIEDYHSGEKDIRGAYLLAKVNNSADAIRKAMQNSNSAVVLHNVDTADVTNDLLWTASAAMKATTDKLKKSAIGLSVTDGRDFLVNALEDALYMQAYTDDCNSLMSNGANKARLAEIQVVVNNHLVEQCDRVAKMSGLPHNCKIEGK